MFSIWKICYVGIMITPCKYKKLIYKVCMNVTKSTSAITEGDEYPSNSFSTKNSSKASKSVKTHGTITKT